MTDQLKPMDVYATMIVPFDVGSYCSERRFAPAVVELSRKLRTLDEAKKAREYAEQVEDEVEHQVKQAIAGVQALMQSSGAV